MKKTFPYLKRKRLKIPCFSGIPNTVAVLERLKHPHFKCVFLKLVDISLVKQKEELFLVSSKISFILEIDAEYSNRR